MDFGTESSIALLLAQHLVKDLARHAAEIYTIHKLSLSLSTRSRFFHGTPMDSQAVDLIPTLHVGWLARPSYHSCEGVAD